MPRSARGFIFDMDGTLTDTVQLVSEAWSYALRSLGYDVPPEAVEPLVGLPAAKLAEVFTGSSATIVELSELRSSYLEARARDAKAFPEVPEVLSKLRSAGFRLSVATSLPSGIARKVLEGAGILGLLDSLVGGDEVQRGKPEPDIFLEACKRVSVQPREAVVVGDRDYDILPAKRIGSFSVLVVRGSYCPSERPDAVVSDLRGLLSLLGEKAR